MSSARKALIIREARPVSEIASEIADALGRVAEELCAISGSLAYIAAETHSETAGEQRELAAVIYHTARKRFGGIKYDGVEIGKATIEQLDKMWLKMLGSKPR